MQVYEVRDLNIIDILRSTEPIYWKAMTINVFLALTLTIKLAGFAPSLTFLDHFWGVAIYAFFCANFNTGHGFLDNSKSCYQSIGGFMDVIELD